jgi:DNA mismatch endonuclease, patch repair protein
MAANRRRDTAPELRIRSLLHASGLRFRVDRPIVVTGRRPIRPDIVFVRPRVAVFVDGCFWHRCPEHGSLPRSNRSYWQEKLARNVIRDRETDTRLTEAGWRVIRIWEHEDPVLASERVRQEVWSRRGEATRAKSVCAQLSS